MPERATLNEITQIGVEATPGAGGPANKLLQGISIEPAIKTSVNPFRPKGAKFPTLAVPGKDWTEAKISGALTYTDVVYLLSSILSYQAPASQGTQTKVWTFTPSQSTPDTIKTYAVECGSPVRAGKFSYGIVTSFGFRFDPRAIEVSGTMVGQRFTDNITLTASPTAIEPVPVLPSQLDVFLDDTSANLGNTKLLRLLRGEFNISDRFGMLTTVNSAMQSWAAHVETQPNATLKLLVEADEQGMALLNNLRQGTKAFVRIAATGDVIETTYHYALQLDLCVTVSDVSEFSDQDGVYAVEWTFNVTHDPTWAKALTCSVTNTLASL